MWFFALVFVSVGLASDKAPVIDLDDQGDVEITAQKPNVAAPAADAAPSPWADTPWGTSPWAAPATDTKAAE